jgi:hypothetical protein
LFLVSEHVHVLHHVVVVEGDFDDSAEVVEEFVSDGATEEPTELGEVRVLEGAKKVGPGDLVEAADALDEDRFFAGQLVEGGLQRVLAKEKVGA